MHHWVKYFVNQCMIYEVITLTSFVTDARTDGPRAFLCPPMASLWRESITIKLGTAYASWTKFIRPPVLTPKWHQWWPWEVTLTSNHLNNIIIIFPDPKNPIKVVLFIIVALLCFVTSTRVVAILDFPNMAAPGVVRLGAHQKSKKYGLGNICAKFGAFGRIWTKNP